MDGTKKQPAITLEKRHAKYANCLHLRGNDFEVVVQAIVFNPKVECILLELDALKKFEQIEALVNALCETKTPKELDLCYSSFDRFVHLFQLLTCKPANVSSLRLFHMFDGKFPAHVVGKYLLSKSCSLNSLAFCVYPSCHYQGDRDELRSYILISILRGVRENGRIQKLAIEGDKLPLDDIRFFSCIMNDYKSLETLEISTSHLEALADCFQQASFELKNLSFTLQSSTFPKEMETFLLRLPSVCPALHRFALNSDVLEIKSDRQRIVFVDALRKLTMLRCFKAKLSDPSPKLLLEGLTPSFQRLWCLDLELSGGDLEGFNWSCFLNSELRVLTLHLLYGERYELSSLFDMLPTMKCLVALSVKVLIAPGRFRFCMRDPTRQELETLLKTVRSMPNLENVEFNHELSFELQKSIDYECWIHKINRDGKLFDAPVGLLPLAMETLSRQGWISLVYYIVRERNDVLIDSPVG
jgi:hypothetical protein